MNFDSTLELEGAPVYMSYGGGKSPHYKLNSWIRECIGFQPHHAYLEPFAGMAGVFIARPKVRCEILNDLNGNVVSWWRCVRDYGDEFQHMIRWTPNSRLEYENALSILKNLPLKLPKQESKESLLKRGLAMHIVLCCSLGTIMDSGSFKSSFKRRSFVQRDLSIIRKRIATVQLENRCALSILDRSSDVKDITIYVDPPYPTSYENIYSTAPLEYDDLSKLLQAQKGQVSISGYDDEWDHLGWHKSTCEGILCASSIFGRSRRERTHALWQNYRPMPAPPSLFD